MNNLAGEALVVRTTGGQRGGGATLTRRATELIELYQAVSREHEHFVARLARLGTQPNQNLEFIEHMTNQTSARNKLAGTVRRLKTGEVNDEVILALGNEHEIVVSNTNASSASLGVHPETGRGSRRERVWQYEEISV